MSQDVRRQCWGRLPNGQEVEHFTLVNGSGCRASVSAFGAALTELWVPDRQGQLEDIVLGFDELEGYLTNHPYFGVTVGRVANRIADGQFELAGRSYRLECNDGPHALHGGSAGFHKVLWEGQATCDARGVGVRLHYKSPDGESGYPGQLEIVVEYRLTEDGSLEIHYEAETDHPTPLNLTNHSYFNFDHSPHILAHELSLSADQYLPITAGRIPTGELRPVMGTPFNFLERRPIGAFLSLIDTDPVGYDHTYVLRQACQRGALAAEVYEPQSGRRMFVTTTEPGIQLYTGNFLDGSITGKQGRAYQQYGGFCLETQHFPDALHHPQFPSIVLRPEQKFSSMTRFSFRIDVS